jgi:hypothetical protein
MTWRELIVTTDGHSIGTLADVVSDQNNCAIECATVHAGAKIPRISSWPDHFISAPGENPDWDTPAEPVDWTGFFEALTDHYANRPRQHEAMIAATQLRDNR